MCGIAGLLGQTDEKTLSEMLERLHHRGPDDEGRFVDEDDRILMGARRLAIVDIDGGDQPIQNEDGSVVAVCNGEIYNHKSLREQLRGQGHRFRSNCDIEVIVHLWEEVGDGLVDHLDGMFAFSLWDRSTGTLVLARDRLGIKPLYYAETDDGVVWGSEIPALLAAGIDGRLDPAAVYNYFRIEYTPSPQTLLANVQKLPPGSIAVVTPDDASGPASERVTPRRYWSLPSDAVPSTSSMAGAASELRRLLSDAVERRLMSDVPVGGFLSGGLDSTATVGLMAEHVSDLKTFAVRFPGKSFDESDEARFAADHFGTDHYEVDVELSSLEHLESLVSHLSEPPRHRQFLPMYALSKLARDQGVRVALSGSGADELFGGYSRYEVVPPRRRRVSRLPGVIHDLADHAADIVPIQHLSYLAALKDEPTVLRRLNCGFNRRPKTDEFLEAGIEDGKSERDDAVDTAMERAVHDDTAHRMMTYDVTYMLPDYVLHKTDHTSMAASLEARVPYLDRRVVEFAHRLPTEYKLNGTRKAVLKRAMADVVPERIRSREKYGMGLPVHEWFRSENGAVARWLTESNLEDTPFIDAEKILERWAEHRRKQEHHGYMLWGTLAFVAWYQTVVTPERPRSPYK
ncbi:asparagine synthase (glutamine-hydrolyzing) [Halobellus ordinarius]|uniref:asparagine synthase (glutamine-hydrolyzing) n=1 Tax=Halobellus ordinarius TaxID=3075120 RepID=UPI0028806DEB|nr:asparagine synthase (glutamine-hydrolyzing) [Halobellus sp. ZY16]